MTPSRPSVHALLEATPDRPAPLPGRPPEHDPLSRPRHVRPLRIGVDARSLLQVSPRGEGQTLLRLYRALLTLRPDTEVLLFTARIRPDSLPLLADLPNVRVVAMDLPGHRIDVWFRATLPWLCLRHRVDVLHASSSGAPRLVPGVPVVTTVHDMIPALLNQPGSKARGDFMRRLGGALRPGRIVACPSYQTRDDLLRLRPDLARLDRIRVLPWGPTVESSTPRRALHDGARAPVLFTFGGSDPRKNTTAVIEAFCSSRLRLQGGRLRVVGVDGDKAMSRFQAQIARHGAADAVELHGFVPDEERERLMTTSDALVYASSYEGFGLPVLDAMTLGLPVLCSDRSCLPEVGGDAVRYFDPTHPATLAAAMDALIDEPGLLQHLRAGGLARAQAFDWTDCARRYLDLFEEVLSLR